MILHKEWKNKKGYTYRLIQIGINFYVQKCWKAIILYTFKVDNDNVIGGVQCTT